MTPYESLLKSLGLEPEKHGKLRAGFIDPCLAKSHETNYFHDSKARYKPELELEDLSWMNPKNKAPKSNSVHWKNLSDEERAERTAILRRNGRKSRNIKSRIVRNGVMYRQ